ncbi:MAG TPA: hypothetical protein DEP69_03835, partial [Acidimicrobiaceae bacterium]|nr:hypothetical protein [Acidimicrobiaceae bacterium]
MVIAVTDDDDDGPATARYPVRVSVANVDEPGTATIAPASTPLSGTALAATLADPDSPAGDFAGLRWQWSSQAAGGPWQPIAGATSPSYTPTDAVGRRTLRATASYADAQGPAKTAESDPTRPVAVAPAAPTLTASAETDGTIVLDWTAPPDDGGSPITRYEYDQRTTGAFRGIWTDLGGGGAARTKTL